VINPKPLVALNHLTVPTGIRVILFVTLTLLGAD